MTSTKVKPKSRFFKPSTRKKGFTRKARGKGKRAVKTYRVQNTSEIKVDKYGQIIGRKQLSSRKIKKVKNAKKKNSKTNR